MDTRTQIIRTADGPHVLIQRAFLLVQAGPDEGLEFELKDRPVVIGRGSTSDLQLEDGSVSREHARLEPDGLGWRIRDLDSKGGTRVNGVAVSDALLEAGSRLKLGNTELELRHDKVELRAPKSSEPILEGIIGRSPAMLELFGLIQKLGPVDLPVQLVGESGSGKEGLARALHKHGLSPDGAYEVVDCTLLGEGVHMRSELFGHVKGAFTGAEGSRDGAFVRAHGGTLFLDEVGELPMELQPLLLRVLQEGEVRPLGGNTVKRVRVRVVSATNRNLQAMVAAGKFRQDLYYRLSALTVEVPPLRERGDDSVLLAKSFLPSGIQLDPEAAALIRSYSWPGNVRELQFAMQQAAALCRDNLVRVSDVRLRSAVPTGTQAAVSPAASTPSPNASSAGAAPYYGAGQSNVTGTSPAVQTPGGNVTFESSRQRVSRLSEDPAAILAALKQAGGNRNEAAKLLGIGRATLFRLLKKLQEDAQS